MRGQVWGTDLPAQPGTAWHSGHAAHASGRTKLYVLLQLLPPLPQKRHRMGPGSCAFGAVGVPLCCPPCAAVSTHRSCLAGTNSAHELGCPCRRGAISHTTLNFSRGCVIGSTQCLGRQHQQVVLCGAAQARGDLATPETTYVACGMRKHTAGSISTDTQGAMPAVYQLAECKHTYTCHMTTSCKNTTQPSATSHMQVQAYCTSYQPWYVHTVRPPVSLLDAQQCGVLLAIIWVTPGPKWVHHVRHSLLICVWG